MFYFSTVASAPVYIVRIFLDGFALAEKVQQHEAIPH